MLDVIQHPLWLGYREIVTEPLYVKVRFHGRVLE